MPLGLDIYVDSLQSKRIKHRANRSTNSNETSTLSEAKLAPRRSPHTNRPAVRIQSITSPMRTILRLLINVSLVLTISIGTALSESDSLHKVEKSIHGVDAYAWAPTDDSLIYATSDGTLWSAKGPDFASRSRIVRIALPQDQKVEQIVRSPDGRSIAVVSPRPNDLWDTIWLVDLKTSKVRDLLPAGAPFGGPGRRSLRISSWLRDGRIAFALHCGAGCVGLHAVSPAGVEYWDFCDASGHLFWSPTRKNAVLQNGHSGAAPADLGLVSASDGVEVPSGASYYRPRRECNSVVKGAAQGGVYFDSWLPDGGMVLFTDARPDRSELKLWNLANGSKKTLVARGSSGALSPDGRYVAFIAPVHEAAITSLSKRFSLAVLDLRSKTIVASREIPTVLPPLQWSPSAAYLAITTDDGKLLLAKLNLAGIELRQTELTEPDFDHELSWSPDGEYLAVWDEASVLKIFIIKLTVSSQRFLKRPQNPHLTAGSRSAASPVGRTGEA